MKNSKLDAKSIGDRLREAGLIRPDPTRRRTFVVHSGNFVPWQLRDKRKRRKKVRRKMAYQSRKTNRRRQ